MIKKIITHAPHLGPKPKPVGLGDAVAMVAQPIARTIDRVVGTAIAKCGGCAKRQEALNRLVPDIRQPLQAENLKG
jgi:hypothetical protein